jgi:tripartite-type tricarboxylate transporter receptor subunit TctC
MPASFMTIRSRAVACSALMVCGLGVTAVNAATYPDRTIRMIVPYPAGGSVDALGRAIGSQVGTSLGQPVVADNRPGANGSIAHRLVADAPADGYTIGMSGMSPLVLAPHQFKDLSYQPVKDFTYLACPGNTPFVINVNPSLPIKNLKELIEYAKSHPGKLHYGSSGLGNSAHLAAEVFNRATGIEMVHVPYKGNAPAMQDLMVGSIQVLFDPVQTSIPQIQAGKVRPIAITSKARFGDLPDLPTVAESGYPDYEFATWYAVVAPAATPAPVVKTLNQEINKAVENPEMKKKFAALGANLVASDPAACSAFVKDEYEKWGKLMKELGIAQQ